MPQFVRAALLTGLAVSTGCFSESATVGLPCTASDQCGMGQVCDGASAKCVLDDGGGGTSGGATDLPPVEECNTNGDFRCAPVGIDIQQCTNGVWTPIDCTTVCPGDQAGACVEQAGAATCLCADAVGEPCEMFAPDQCSNGGQLEFCLEGQTFLNDCSTDCENAGYSVAGPCVDPDTGEAQCTCADNLAGGCSVSQEGFQDCADVMTATVCVQGDIYETDCMQECARLGTSGGACVAGTCNCLP